MNSLYTSNWYKSFTDITVLLKYPFYPSSCCTCLLIYKFYPSNGIISLHSIVYPYTDFTWVSHLPIFPVYLFLPQTRFPLLIFFTYLPVFPCTCFTLFEKAIEWIYVIFSDLFIYIVNLHTLPSAVVSILITLSPFVSVCQHL